MKVQPWHSKRPLDSKVYHDHTRCTEGQGIPAAHHTAGGGGRPHCPDCAHADELALDSKAKLGALPVTIIVLNAKTKRDLVAEGRLWTGKMEREGLVVRRSGAWKIAGGWQAELRGHKPVQPRRALYRNGE